MKQSELREIVKQTILENQKSSTKLGKELSEGDILSANGKKIISIERNKPLQGKLTIKIEGSNKPLIFDEQSEYGVTTSLKENQPQRSPQRQAPDREVIEKPDTDTPSKPTRRRTLTPPEHAPDTKPKAESVIKENEQEVANKIASRFQKLGGGINEIRVDTFKPVPQEKVDIFAEKKKQELIASGKTEKEAESYKQKILQSYENQLGLYNIKMSRFKK